MQRKGDIEKFLRDKLGNLEHNFQDDWAVFERKLQKALYLKRLRRMAIMGGFSLFLLSIFMGVNVYHIWSYDFYIPRNHKVTFEEIPANPVFNQWEQTNISGQGITANNHSQESANQNSKFPGNKSPVSNTPLPVADKRINPETGFTSTLPNQKDNTRSSTSLGKPGLAEASSTGDEREATVPARGDRIDVSRNGVVQVQGLEMPENPLVLQNASPKLSYTTGNQNALGFPMPVLSVRTPIEAVKISPSRGPYISPLEPTNPWSYSINVYPNFTFRRFVADEDKFNLLHRDFVDAVQAAESGGFSLNIGFEVSRRIGDITYVNTGVEYISYKTDVAYNFVNFREANLNQNGEIIGYTLKEETENISFSDVNVYHYLNFPLSFSYQPWATDHIRLNIEMGASFLYFMTARGQTLNYKTLEIIDLSELEYRNYIGSLCFKVGANYFVSERVNIGFEPTIMYFTNTIYPHDYPFRVIPYSVGLNLNLQVKLN